MAQPKRFERPGSLIIERHVVREGPSPYFVVWRPFTSRMFYDIGEMLRFIRWAKGTPTREALDEWLLSLDEPKEAPTVDMDAIKREGFGPEAHALDESDPNNQTKMIT